MHVIIIKFLGINIIENPSKASEMGRWSELHEISSLLMGIC